MIFRKPCSIVIVVFAAFNLVFFKKLHYTKNILILMACIASPVILELLLFWNNDSLAKGLKAIEKSTSLIIFPLFIIGNFQRINFLKLVQTYVFGTTLVLLFYFIRFNVLYPDLMHKYLNGIHLWEMGYQFGNSVGIHAPALNMHLAFVTVSAFYFVIKSFKDHEKSKFKAIRIIIFILSFFFVLFVNTRMALVNVFIGFLIVLFYAVKQNNLKKIALKGLPLLVLLIAVLFLFVQKDPYMKEKYSSVSFAYMDKVGKLDDIDHPEVKVFNSLVTRVSIWKSAWELSLKNLPFGVGASDGKNELNKYYAATNQKFLAKYEFPTHNQFLDFLLKFGILGPLVVLFYISIIAYLGFDLKNPIIISFFVIFFTSNLMDDFLLRFDGIAFSGFWLSIFSSYWLQQKSALVNVD